jgi:hypothetical protein
MGTGEFTFEEVSLEPQVILLDNHGWEIVRIPMYRDFGKETQTINTSELSKYDSPMVETNGYHWYPKAAKVTGYHKYTISDPEPKINIYTYGDDPSTTEVKDEWYIGESVAGRVHRGEATGISGSHLWERVKEPTCRRRVPGRSGRNGRTYSEEREVTRMLDTKNVQK